MKLVQGDEIPLQRGLEYRGGMFHSRRVLEGEAGSIDNFQLSIGVSQGDFYSPRHHHNFEQIRVGLEGTLDFDRDGKMSPGVVGYFPEGVYYGPQSQDPNGVATAAVLQFGGASGSGYLSNAEVRAGMEELKKHGEFKNGVYHRRVPFHGKKNADGYQAIWEHLHERPMVYPAPRYTKPVFMNASNSEWIPVDGAPGVFEKLLGVFTERRTEAGFLKLAHCATHSVKGRGIYLVLSGAGEINGEPMRKLTALYLEQGESATITAREESELMHFGLPNLADLSMPVRDALPAEAAE
jgi:hypothetical protein